MVSLFITQDVSLECRDFTAQPVYLQSPRNAGDQPTVLHRFHQVIERPCFHAFDSGFNAVGTGHYYYRHFRVVIHYLRQQLLAGESWHLQVKNDYCCVLYLVKRQQIATFTEGDNLIGQNSGEDMGGGEEDILLIVHQYYRGQRSRAVHGASSLLYLLQAREYR